MSWNCHNRFFERAGRDAEVVETGGDGFGLLRRGFNQPTLIALQIIWQCFRGKKHSTAKIFHYRLGPRMNVQLLIDRAHVAPYCIDADLHPVGDFFIGVTLGELLEKFLFARGEF